MHMFTEIIIAIAIGILAGSCTGLIPGIHVNLVSVFLITISPFLLRYTNPLSLAMFVIAMAVVHTFLDFIPSVYLVSVEKRRCF